MSISAHPQPAAQPHAQPLAAWLGRIAEQRNFTLPPPADERAAALTRLLDVLSREFADYRDVTARARDASRRNAEQLESVVRSAASRGDAIRHTADAAAEAGSGASIMAAAAEALYGLAKAASEAASDAGANLATIDGALRGLEQRLADGSGPLDEMREATYGVADFPITLARLSRHAQLLGVNASIEAAHLAEAGSRFGIVAEEVRKLSTSTRESRADVASIVGQLREATDRVAAAVGDSKTATGTAGEEITGAGAALAQTAQGIDEFEAQVGVVAELAATQRMTLEAIAAAVDQIAQHTAEAAAASRDAAELDLDAPLERAAGRVARWTLRGEHASAAGSAAGPLGDWIALLAGGGDPAAACGLDADPAESPIAAAVRALLERVAADQRDILGDVVAAAVAVSRNSYAWVKIGGSFTAINTAIAHVRATIDESAHSARTSAELAGQMRELGGTIRGRYETALTLLEGALTRIARITSSVRDIDGYVETMGSAAARAEQIMGLIETLSAETDLLSLNAAIEAAHAGELGLGFSVIAEEIRALARSTNDSTATVTQLVSGLIQISSGLQTSMSVAAESMTEVVASAEGVRGSIAGLRSSFETAMERALEVATTAAEQSRSLDRVLDNVSHSAGAAGDRTSGADSGRIELAMLGSRAHAIAARRPLGTVVERIRAFAETLCGRIETALDRLLADGRVSLDQLFDLRYEPIVGSRIATLSRLFDVSRVPAAGFDPPKFASPWDALVDEAIIAVLTTGWDELTAAGIAPVAIFVSDLNGLFYAYPRQKIAAWTNDPALDGLGNRIKRFFEDEYTLRVVRCGLGPAAAELGPRATYQALRAAGCDLQRGAQRPWGGFVYARDTSAVCNEVVTAYYARDRRHGALRICYDPNLI